MSATEAPGVPKAMPEGRRLRHPRFQDARIGLNLRAKGESPKKIFLGQFFLMVRSTNGVPFNLAQQPCQPYSSVPSREPFLFSVRYRSQKFSLGKRCCRIEILNARRRGPNTIASTRVTADTTRGMPARAAVRFEIWTS